MHSSEVSLAAPVPGFVSLCPTISRSEKVISMQSVDLEVLSCLHDWLAEGKDAFLCTVVKTWGSSPRPVGSLLCTNGTGQTMGSLSGGCVEDDLLEKLQTGQVAATKPEFVQYGLTSEDTERLGLPCGGVLYVLVEPLRPSAASLEHFDQLLEHTKARRCTLRQVEVATGRLQLREAPRVLDLVYDDSDPQQPMLYHYYGPKYQLFLIGAGIVSMYLADLAQKLDYQVTVCDPRENLLASWSGVEVRKLCMMPDDAVRAHAKDPMTAIVALTHDPRIDDMAMMEALTTDAFYVGTMGSDRTSTKRRERLQALDLTPQQLARLHAPVGLPLGSKTPPEIAIAVIADVLATQKRQDGLARTRLSELQEAV